MFQLSPTPPPCSSPLAPRSLPTPSRYSNPFATCWTRPGALAFRWPSGQSAESLVAQLEQQQWRGAIIGPHGSGKSTLLQTLIPVLQAADINVFSITLQNAQRRLPAGFLSTPPHEGPSLLIIDGYEQLAWFERFRLNRYCRKIGSGLLVTSHTALRIPTLIELAPDERLVQHLFEELAARTSTPLLPIDVLSSYERHGANVREILFDLYDRHEQLLRGATVANRAAYPTSVAERRGINRAVPLS